MSTDTMRAPPLGSPLPADVARAVIAEYERINGITTQEPTP